MGLAAAAPEFGPIEAPSRPHPGWAIEVAESPAAFEETWRALEAASVASPYARFDWVDAYAKARPTGAVRVALVRDAAGQPALLFPLETTRRLGLAIAGTVGGRHANLGLPLVRQGFLSALSPDRAAGLALDIGRSLGADLVRLGDLPVTWAGEPNPFAAGGVPPASPTYRLDLAADGDATLKRSMSADARKKLRAKERNLAKLGAVTLVEARDAREVDLILAAFYRQKGDRFGELGIADPFADPAVRAFVRDGATRRLAEGRPAIELYGLALDGRILAAFGGAASPERLSGMFLSFDPGEAARFSPGDLLLTRVIARQCERGRSVFDLGVGEARYKRQICDGIEPMVDLLVPVTAMGRAAAFALGLKAELKRRLKADPRAMALLGRARRAVARLRG